MTLCIAAKFKEGIVCVSDSAVSVGHNRLTKPDIKGWWRNESFVMFSGTLYYAQEIYHSGEKALRAAILEVKVDHKDDEEDDSAELLEVKDGEIVYHEHTGASMKAGDYGAIGHGSTMGLALLDMIYQPNRSEKWLRVHLENILRIVEKYDVTVFRPSRFEVIPYEKCQP
jgi:hypothetical protein